MLSLSILYLLVLNTVLLYQCPPRLPDSHRLIFYELNWRSPLLPLNVHLALSTLRMPSTIFCSRTVISLHKGECLVPMVPRTLLQ